MLNVGLRPDGSLPENQREEALLEVGEWLRSNGQAIFGSRPWETFGEGPTNVVETDHELGPGHFNESELAYTEEDFRFTVNDGRLFAVCLGTPTTRLEIRSLALGNPFENRPVVVTALADGAELTFEQTTEALIVHLPHGARRPSVPRSRFGSESDGHRRGNPASPRVWSSCGGPCQRPGRGPLNSVCR